MSAPAVAELQTQPRGWVLAFRGPLWPVIATVGMLALLWGRFLATLVFDWKVDPQYAHGWFIPLLALVLLGTRWNALPAARPTAHRAGLFTIIALCLGALTALAFLQEVYPEARPFQWAHGLLVGAITFALVYLHGGRAWMKHLAFPICFLLLAIPWPRTLQSQITDKLMHGVAAATVELTLLTGTPAVQQGNAIGLTDGAVSIDEACSGVRSLHGSLIIGLFLGSYYGLGAFGRFALPLLAVVGSLALNVVRATALTWISATQGHQVLEKFHDPAGLAILAVVFIAAVATANAFAKRQTAAFAPARSAHRTKTKEPQSRERAVPQPSTVILSEAPAGAGGRSAVEGSPISGRSEAEPWRGKPSECREALTPLLIAAWLILTDIACFAYFGPRHRGDFREWQLDFTGYGAAVHNAPLSPTARQFLRFDSGEGRVIDRPNGTEVHVVDLRWHGGEISAAGARLHHAAACLPSIGYELSEPLGEVQLQVHGIDMHFEANGFNAAGRTAYVYQGRWENGAPGRAEDLDQSLGSVIRATKERRRLDRARVLLLMFIGPTDAKAAERELTTFLNEAVVPPPDGRLR